MVKGTKSGFHIEPGCPVRIATARFRRAWVVAHSRPAVDPTESALDPLATLSQVFSKQSNASSFMVRNLTHNRRKIFHLNCVPRQNYLHIALN